MKQTLPTIPAGVMIATVVALVDCASGPGTAPDLSPLEWGMSYPAVETVAGEPCEHLHDRGVRVLAWIFADGSHVEATIHDGRLSGLELDDGNQPRGRSVAAVRVKAGVQSDMPEAELRERLGEHAVAGEDTSDRECRWDYADGSLEAIFMRGRLERAIWNGSGSSEPLVLVEEIDAVPRFLTDLSSPRRSDRYRALQGLESGEDSRVADALVDLLRVETDRGLRAKAATLLADAGDLRVSDLLLPDLEQEHVPDWIIAALARVGDARAEAALARAQKRQEPPATRRKIQNARKAIDRRIGRDWPPSQR